MKYHKYVASNEYVAYPVWIELKRINNALGNSLQQLANILVSGIVGVLIGISPISDMIVNRLKASTCEYVALLGSCKNANIYIDIFLIGLVYGAVSVFYFIKVRWSSDKNTSDKRKDVAQAFYKVAIPRLELFNSIIEEHDAVEDGGIDKKYWLLIRAKYELEGLINLLTTLNVIELDARLNMMKADSRDVLNLIGQEIYFIFLCEVMDNIAGLYNRLLAIKDRTTRSTLDSLEVLLAAKAFSVINRINMNDELLERAKQQYKMVNKDVASHETVTNCL